MYCYVLLWGFKYHHPGSSTLVPADYSLSPLRWLGGLNRGYTHQYVISVSLCLSYHLFIFFNHSMHDCFFFFLFLQYRNYNVTTSKLMFCQHNQNAEVADNDIHPNWNWKLPTFTLVSIIWEKSVYVLYSRDLSTWAIQWHLSLAEASSLMSFQFFRIFHFVSGFCILFPHSFDTVQRCELILKGYSATQVIIIVTDCKNEHIIIIYCKN